MFLKLLVLFDAITLARGDCLADQHADLMVDAASSQTTGLFLKKDSFARWQPSAAWCPKTASWSTGSRDRTD
jgi:hypothetical protein